MAEEDRRALLHEVSGMGFGSLGGVGVDDHESVKASLDPSGKGVMFKLACQGCGKPLGVVAEWPELIYMSQGMPPGNSWYHSPSDGCFMPNLRCGCLTPIQLGVTPDECTKHLRSGIAGGKIQAAYVSNAVAQLHGAGQQR